MNIEHIREEKQKRPPWWFITAVWSGIAGSAAALAALLGATAE